jgi:hypothetical protein
VSDLEGSISVIRGKVPQTLNTKPPILNQVSDLEGISVIRGKVGSFVELKGTSNGKAFDLKLERRPVIPRAGMAIRPAPSTDEQASNGTKNDSDKKDD